MIHFPALFKDASLICIVILIFSSSIGYGTLTLFPKAYNIMDISDDEIVLPSDDLSTWDYVLKLYLSNLEISMIAFLGGFLFGIGPIIMLFLNGFMFGAIFKMLTENGPVFLLSLVPHLILEIPAFIIACALGLLAGESVLNYVLKREKLEYGIKDLCLLFFLYPVILLGIAAIIEGLYSVRLLNMI